jgi:hypothetical protein
MCRDPRVYEHRRREIFDQQSVSRRHRFVLEVELTEIRFLHSPLVEETFNVTDAAIGLPAPKISSIANVPFYRSRSA